MVRVAPTKRVIGPTRLSVSGYYCFRNLGMIAYESTLERDLLRRLAVNRRVLAVESQPLTLLWDDSSGRACRYTPDYLVHWRWMGEFYRLREPPWLIEVKPRAELRKSWRRWHAKFRIAARHAAEQGWRFRLLDESRIRDVMFENAARLERYRALHHTFSVADLPPALFDGGLCQIEQIVARLPGAPEARLAYVWHLLAVGYLDGDLTQALDRTTEVWLADES